jgi:hypothetical protein
MGNAIRSVKRASAAASADERGCPFRAGLGWTFTLRSWPLPSTGSRTCGWAELVGCRGEWRAVVRSIEDGNAIRIGQMF